MGDRLCSERVELSSLSEVLLVYHRHLECLFKSTRYVTISHVWHPGVSELQYKKTAADVDGVAQIVREVPVRICLGLAKSAMGSFEVWHDYISVPQWQYIWKY